MSSVAKTDEIPADDQLADIELICIDCSRIFPWTAGEQKFFSDHGLLNPPKRCKPCKKAKNVRIAAIEESRKTGDRAKIEVSITCEKCEIQTTVPFYPSQGRPVYCRNCFKNGADNSIAAAGV